MVNTHNPLIICWDKLNTDC